MEFDHLWDYNDPETTEARFRLVLPDAAGPYAELLTQIARTYGLRRQFDEAHALLDRVDGVLSDAGPRARVRYLLERGRTFNSSGEPDASKPLFREAFDIARIAGEDNLAADAAHMLGIVEPPDEAMAWNYKAMEIAEQSQDEKARKWLGPLYNNLGWTLHDMGRFDESLELFQKGVAFREQQGDDRSLRIARWSVGRTYRSLGRVEDALGVQESLMGNDATGYVSEEMGECLLLLGRDAEAKPHFARAYDLLSADTWLAENEPDRLARLKELAS